VEGAAARDGLWCRHGLLARLRDWQRAGIWQLIHYCLLDWLARYGQIDWSGGSGRRQFDPGSFGGAQTGPNPTDRAKLGSKRHLICDGRGVPLAIQLTGANRNDSQQALALVDAIPSLQGGRGRPRHRPDCVLGDLGYDAESIRQGLRDKRIISFLAKRNTEHGSGLGRWRWVVERTFAWLNQFQAAGSIRKADRHSRGVLVPRVCSDLLALPASRLSGGLKIALPTMH
jgi:transposase